MTVGSRRARLADPEVVRMSSYVARSLSGGKTSTTGWTSTTGAPNSMRRSKPMCLQAGLRSQPPGLNRRGKGLVVALVLVGIRN